MPHHPTRQNHLLSRSINIQGLKWGSSAEEGAPDGRAQWQGALSGATGAQDLARLLLGLETGSAPVQGTKRTGSPLSTESALAHMMGSPGKPSPGESRPQGILGASRCPFLGLSHPHSSTPTVPIEPKSGETGDCRHWAGTGAGTCRNGERKGWGLGTAGRLWESSRTTIGSLKSQGSERSLRWFCRKILHPHCFDGTPGRKPAGLLRDQHSHQSSRMAWPVGTASPKTHPQGWPNRAAPKTLMLPSAAS